LKRLLVKKSNSFLALKYERKLLMKVTIDLWAFSWFIIFCLAIVIGVFMIILLRKCLKVVDKVNNIIENNSDSITSTISALPSALKSIDEVAVSAKGTLDKANSIVSTVEDNVSDTFDSFSVNAENVLNIINIASTVIKSIIGAFSK
jgi:predicted PurR-regulated permease PerM